ARTKSGWKNVAGTSIAAPVVAYTAGLLRAEGMTSARAVMHRLLVSATRNEALVDYVRDGRVLNVVDATTVYEDVVVVGSPDGEETRYVGTIAEDGELSRTHFVSALNGARVDARVARLDRFDHAGPSDWRAVATFEDRGSGDTPTLRTKRVKFGSSTLEILARDGQTHTINVGDISRIVFRSLDPPSP
ncbi:MAG TPA: hypothetical protein VFL14_13200, partial [Xanthomonadales bacterium]|nr:hypothetical protein [Xanthomonadales bacterium]